MDSSKPPKAKNILDIYCQQMSRGTPPRQLTKSETEEYFTRYENLCQLTDGIDDPNPADVKAKKEVAGKIVTSCLPYVLKLAQNYSKNTDDKELLLELLAEGNVGLCIAVDKYDKSRGVPFHIYASHWIKANYHSIRKTRFNMVKNSEVASSTYIDEFGSNADLDYVESHVKSATQYAVIEENENVKGLQTALKRLEPHEQMVLRLGFELKNSAIKFSVMTRMFGKGFAPNVSSDIYYQSRRFIERVLRNSSIVPFDSV